jgi:hypothetical protein
MTDLLVTATHDNLNGANGDTAVNTFAFRMDVPFTQTVAVDIANAIADFYNGSDPGNGVNAVSSYMSSTLDRSSGASRLRFYDITGLLQAVVPAGSPAGTKPRPPAHGSPVYEDAFTLGAAGAAASLPSQIACAITLRGRDALQEPVEGPGDTRPRARRSGRLFIGPLSTGASDQAANPRPTAAFRNNLTIACERLQDNLVDGDYVWSIWSRAAGSLSGIERVEVDDSFDVIRSRKNPPTTRTVLTFAPEPALVLGA